MRATIALLPGDGIGPEVTHAAAAALEMVGRRFGHTFEMATWPIGGTALRQGLDPLPPGTREACLVADAVLLGAVGDQAFDAAPRQRRPEAGLLALRQALGAYANLRPAVVWPGLEGNGPLKPEKIAGADLFIVRELTGGLYFGEPRGIAPDGASAVNTLRYSREEVVRIAEVAFAAARLRRRYVVSVDKANVLETSQLWRSVVNEVAERYQDVKLEHMYVDACAMNLVMDPRRFDVILTENLFGDILSDEAGAVVGSLGLLPSASLGSGPGLFEPVHGSAPTLVGRDIANPIGAIASAAMLLRYSLHKEDEAQVIERAIGEVLAEGYRTHDLAVAGGPAPVSCSQMARAIHERIG